MLIIAYFKNMLFFWLTVFFVFFFNYNLLKNQFPPSGLHFILTLPRFSSLIPGAAQSVDGQALCLLAGRQSCLCAALIGGIVRGALSKGPERAARVRDGRSVFIERRRPWRKDDAPLVSVCTFPTVWEELEDWLPEAAVAAADVGEACVCLSLSSGSSSRLPQGMLPLCFKSDVWRYQL